MQVEAICAKCGSRYRVAAHLAGRTAKCKHCGNAIVIPRPPGEIGDTDVETSAPAPMSAAPSFDSLIALKPQEEKEETTYEETPPLLPPIVTDAILPLIVSLICFVWIGVMLVPRALHSGSPVIAFVLMGFALGLYLVVTLPLSLRAVEGAAKASAYELPNAVGLQTFSAIAIPTAAMVFGYFAGGIPGVFIALIVGCAVM